MPQGGVVGGVCSHWFEWHIFKTVVYLTRVYEQYIGRNVRSLASEETVRFEIEVGFTRNLKNVTVISCKNHAKQQCQAAMIYARYMSSWQR